jgi:thiol-disulfide isomerase/thioredoxin
MYQIAIAARLVLAAVFAVAAVMKARDGARLRAGLVEFGVPRAFAGPGGVLLVVAESATALALLWGPAAHAGAAAALALLVLFSAAIAANLARGRTPACNCFGQVHAVPIGWSTVARNGVFGAIAAALLWLRSDGGTVDPALTALGAIALVIVALQLQLVQQQGRILLRLEALEGSDDVAAEPAPPGLPIGAVAPAFGGDALVAEGKPVVLVFTSTSCGPCEALLPELAHWQREYASVMTLALVQDEPEVAAAYLAHGTPSAVLVGTDGRIASRVAQGADAIRRLVGQCLDAGPSGASPRGLTTGDAVPPISVERLDGVAIPLADAFVGPTVLLFWNPRCGFCDQMLPALRAWVERRGDRAPRVVIVSSGEAQEHDTIDLQCSILLDRGFEAVSAFGASGTPMAILIDDRGAVASELVAGKDAIFRLLDAEEARASAPAVARPE